MEACKIMEVVTRDGRLRLKSLDLRDGAEDFHMSLLLLHNSTSLLEFYLLGHVGFGSSCDL